MSLRALCPQYQYHETMREMVLQSSGWGLIKEEGLKVLCLLLRTARGHHDKVRLKQKAVHIRGEGILAGFSLKIIC